MIGFNIFKKVDHYLLIYIFDISILHHQNYHLYSVCNDDTKNFKNLYDYATDESYNALFIDATKGKPIFKKNFHTTIYKSSQEILHKRAIEERVRANLIKWNNAMMPQ
jgi:hypothetical protein